MSTPRFHPRCYTVEPGVFGKARMIGWCQATSAEDETKLMASQIQHAYAVRIRDLAVDRYGDLKSYADATGTDYQRLAKVLRGEAIMRLEDIAEAHRHLGVPLPGLSDAK
jgi:hypothetical protein